MEYRLRKGQKELWDPAIAFRSSDIPVFPGSSQSTLPEKSQCSTEHQPCCLGDIFKQQRVQLLLPHSPYSQLWSHR